MMGRPTLDIPSVPPKGFAWSRNERRTGIACDEPTGDMKDLSSAGRDDNEWSWSMFAPFHSAPCGRQERAPLGANLCATGPFKSASKLIGIIWNQKENEKGRHYVGTCAQLQGFQISWPRATYMKSETADRILARRLSNYLVERFTLQRYQKASPNRTKHVFLKSGAIYIKGLWNTNQRNHLESSSSISEIVTHVAIRYY
jgi:hypothetical protein